VNCVICGNEIIGHGHNAEPVKKGRCCDKCKNRVIVARLRSADWSREASKKIIYSTQIIGEMENSGWFAKRIDDCFKEYFVMNWGQTHKGNWSANDKAVWWHKDRVLAKYTTQEGDIFIITEWDNEYQSRTTILFCDEY
jgi:hypothetical protein